jgi:flagellar motor switch protein FliN/FliY
MDKLLTKSEVASETKLNVLVDALREAIGGAYSSSLNSPWNVVVAEETASPSKSEASPLCFDLIFSGNLKGCLSVQMTDSDARKLAQAVAANSTATAGGTDILQPLEELWDKVTTQVEAALKRTWSDLHVELHSTEAKPGGGTRICLLASDASAAMASPLDIFVDPDLLDSLAPSTEAVGTAAEKSPDEAVRSNLDLFLGVNLDLTLRFGKCVRSLREVLDLNSGSMIELDREVQQPADLLLGSKLVARGEVIIVDGNYGIRITEVVDAGERLEAI